MSARLSWGWCLLASACSSGGGGGVAGDAGVPAVLDAEVVDASAADGSADVDAPDAHVPDAEVPDAEVRDALAPEAGVDLDLDGLDDAWESRLAEEYLPFRSIDATDECALSAIVYRVRPHPDAPDRRVHLIADSLFERDCGASSHVGDNEVFGVTIDPTLPAPAGILAIRAISHQNTVCQAITDCGPCPNDLLPACATGMRRGALYPVVFYSKNKHGAYLHENECDRACFVTNFCTLEPTPTDPPMINAGEPGAPLVRDLTAAGIITSTAGWTEPEVFNFDPWGEPDFGGAGNVAEDLVDDAFLTPSCL